MGYIRCELIPRDVLFGRNDYSGISLSADGKMVGYLAADKHNRNNLFVICATCTYAEQATFEENDIIRL
uniref:GNAT family N-acetyltransferase n=1 Tax=Ascaris lumbricoides TaxID=6252 RepID=A0A0M3HJY2_ASCLU